MRTDGMIVVGVDASAASESALQWALHKAARRRADLCVVNVCELSRSLLHGSDDFESKYAGHLRIEGQRLLDDALALARSSAPDLQISGSLRVGSAASILIEESEAAEMLVVGNRGVGGFVGLLLGSTALDVATHAHCAVVAVPTPGRDAGSGRGVVVGVEGMNDSPAVLDFAFREAASLGEPVSAVHAWRPPVPLGPGRTMPELFDEDQAAAAEGARLAEAVRECAGRYPAVELHQRSVRGHPAKVLIDEAQGARLLVVGNRGRGEFRSRMLGSVSHAILHHAHRPVAVVPQRA